MDLPPPWMKFPFIGPLVPVAVGLAGSVFGCLTHWVSPAWPAIMAMALGVEGVSSVAKMLSKIVKWLAQSHMNGTVSQSMCCMTTLANCLPLRWLAVVAGAATVP